MRYGSIRVVMPVVLAGLTGCANYDKLRETAPQASTYELCRVGYMTNDSTVRDIAYGELHRRRQDCSQWNTAFAQERAANAQQAANAMALIRAMQPPPPAPIPLPAQPVRCTSYAYGNQVQTTCQ